MKKLIVPGLVLYTFCSGLGLFLVSGLSTPFLFPWMAGYLVLLFTVSYLSLFTKERSFVLELIILATIGVNAVIQATGGIYSPFHPAYYLIAAAAAFQPRMRPYYATALILAIEGGNLFRSEKNAWPLYAAFAGSLAGVVFVTAPIISRIRTNASIIRERYEKLLADANSVDPLAANIKINALSEQNRQAVNINTAIEREGAFKGLISMIYEIIPAHTYALFLAERENGIYVLRAIRSESRHVAGVGTRQISKGSGLVGICIDKNQPQYLADTVIPAINLGYYTHDVPVKSLLAIPIAQGERTLGVLVVDSLERDAFSPDNQDLLTRFAPFFSEIIEKIRISRELDLRAKNFATLHEMSSTLNSSLEIAGVLQKLGNQIKSVIPFDYCAFVVYDERNGNGIITAVCGYESKMAGRKFPLEESVIMTRMLNDWVGRNSAAAYYYPDLGNRGEEIGLFPFKELQRPFKSLYGRPLTAREKFVGAVFLGSSKINAFNEYYRHFLDTLLNQVSMVVDNSMLHSRLLEMAHTDGLTGLLNHRTFMEKLDEEFKRLDRDEEQHFSLLLMDIDYFKKVNDEYGHPVGDVALKNIAAIIRDMARSIDFVGRYGGEEFAIGMVGADTDGARKTAERIRKNVEQTKIIAGKITLKRTISIGVASYKRGCDKPDALIARADLALYDAKHAGRNRVCVYRESDKMDRSPAPSPVRS